MNGHPGRAHEPVSECLSGVADTDWAYLAGIVDGEGHFNAALGTNSFGIVVKMAEPEVVAHLSATFGGMAGTHERAEPRRLLYRWTFQRMADVQYACRKMLPFMVLKRDECAAMLALADHIIDKRPRWPSPTSTVSAAERIHRRAMLARWKTEREALRERVAEARTERKAASRNVPLAA